MTVPIRREGSFFAPVRCKWDSMCKIHELGQCLTVRLITDVPGHAQGGFARLVPGQTSAIFASPRLIECRRVGMAYFR
jgi:hypothetical protein